jgi:hypothetical protein
MSLALLIERVEALRPSVVLPLQPLSPLHSPLFPVLPIVEPRAPAEISDEMSVIRSCPSQGANAWETAALLPQCFSGRRCRCSGCTVSHLTASAAKGSGSRRVGASAIVARHSQLPAAAQAAQMTGQPRIPPPVQPSDLPSSCLSCSPVQSPRCLSSTRPTPLSPPPLCQQARSASCVPIVKSWL